MMDSLEYLKAFLTLIKSGTSLEDAANIVMGTIGFDEEAETQVLSER